MITDSFDNKTEPIFSLKDFYGQEISDEVLAFVKENPEMLCRLPYVIAV